MQEQLDIYVDASSGAPTSKMSGIGLVATTGHSVVELDTFIKPYETRKITILESMGIEHAITCALNHVGEYKRFVIHNDNTESVKHWKAVLKGTSQKSNAVLLHYLPDIHTVAQARILSDIGALCIVHTGRQASAQSRLADRLAYDAYVSPKTLKSTRDAFAYITKHSGTKKKIKGYEDILNQASSAAGHARCQMSERVLIAKNNVTPAVVYHPGFFASAAFEQQLAAHFN
jgi:hypothetical protein